MDTLIEQLIRVYYEDEQWHKDKMTYEEIKKYYETLFTKERIITYVEKDELLGYLESWRLNAHQLIKVLSHQRFPIAEENINQGPLCYLASLWVKKDRRQGYVIKKLRRLFYKYNRDADYFCGEEFNHGNRFRMRRNLKSKEK